MPVKIRLSVGKIGGRAAIYHIGEGFEFMPLQTEYNKDTIKESILNKLLRYYGCTIEDATPKQVYAAVASTVRDQIMLKWRFEKEARRAEKAKRLYYLSIEFLTGRWLHNNLLNLCSTKEYEQAFEELGLTLRGVLHEEPEPALGNGGLGRLAACFLDSLATLNLPAMGCTIRYEYGLFRQRIVDGQQVEVPDEWLTYGNAWEIPTQRDAVEVCFGGQMVENWVGGTNYVTLKNTENVIAVPYDLPILGYDSDVVDRLRTWSAVLPQNFNLEKFSAGDYNGSTEDSNSIAAQISKVLYPEDNTYNGKKLRLMQEYFLVSATLQYAIKDFKRVYGTDMSQLPEKVAFHINDTHPAMVIPELMRILVDEERLPWEEAERITQATVAYTNHTIMAEALEKWPENMMRETLPRIYSIMQELNRRLCQKLFDAFPGQWDRIGHMAILAYDQAHMANMCVAYSHAVNGVSQLHGDILKHTTFADYYSIMPEKFYAITNGITPRRWLALANPPLSKVLDEHIGRTWRTDLSQLDELKQHIDYPMVNQAVRQAKFENKQRLASYIAQQLNVVVNPKALFDVQIKRIHEYKRQLMNVLHVITRYNRIKADPQAEWVPRVNIFAGKAASAYYMAKHIIHLINDVAAVINNDPQIGDKLKVVFIPNYSVSLAQLIIPAADLSEQISLAGTEASGTSNMKFALNGALTIGTLDGANVEMQEHVGEENIFIFGNTAEEVEELRRSGYKPREYYEQDEELHQALTQIGTGVFSPAEPGRYRDLLDSLINFGDHYQVLADYRSYVDCQDRVDELYQNPEEWAYKAMLNIANMGYFSSDRTIQEYAKYIWHIDPVRL